MRRRRPNAGSRFNEVDGTFQPPRLERRPDGMGENGEESGAGARLGLRA